MWGLGPRGRGSHGGDRALIPISWSSRLVMTETHTGTCWASTGKCQQSWTCDNCGHRGGSRTLWSSLWHCLWSSPWLPLLNGPGNSMPCCSPRCIPEAGAHLDPPSLPAAAGPPTCSSQKTGWAFKDWVTHPWGKLRTTSPQEG